MTHIRYMHQAITTSLTMKAKLVKQNRAPRGVIHLDYKIYCKILHKFIL